MADDVVGRLLDMMVGWLWFPHVFKAQRETKSYLIITSKRHIFPRSSLFGCSVVVALFDTVIKHSNCSRIHDGMESIMVLDRRC